MNLLKHRYRFLKVVMLVIFIVLVVCVYYVAINNMVLNSCLNGDVEAVSRLLSKGANVNACNGRGVPLLSLVASSGTIEMAKLLIKHGADVNKKAKLPAMAVLSDLRSYDRPNNATQYATPLMFAVWHGNLDMVDLLLRSGANIRLKAISGYDAFYYAAAFDNKNVLGRLIRDVPLSFVDTSITCTAETMLMVSVRRKCESNVHFLLMQGVNPAVSNQNGTTAISIAESMGQTNIIRMLRKFSVTPSQ